MELTTLERAIEMARALTPAEQQQLRAMLEPRLAATSQEQERLLARHLLDIGMIDHIPEGYPAGYAPPPPIVINGEPLSETVIRERR